MKDNIHFLEDGYYVEKLEKENQQLRNALEKLKDSAGWREILELSGIVQERDKYKEVIDKATKFYLQELAKREQLQTPQNMPWESVEMFNILEGNK